MKITSISDTHGFHTNVTIEPTDLLLFAGDAMTTGYNILELTGFLHWFSKQPAKYKVMIAGNHCRWIEDNSIKFKRLLEDYPEIIYLEDNSIEIEGFKIYGTPYQKVFYNWAFNRSEQELESIFKNIPLDTDILLTHAPEYLILDELIDGNNVGEFTLSKQIMRLTNLKLHVFGHIHNGFGMVKPHSKHISINASQVDENYDLKNFPITIKL